MADDEPVGRLQITFANLVGSGTRPGEVIVLGFRGSDGRRYELDFAAGCASAMILALRRHQEELDPASTQPMAVTAVQGARFEDGSPLLVLGLEGGGQLSLKFAGGDLNELIGQLERIRSPADRPRH